MDFVSVSACSGMVKFMAQVQASLLLSPVFRLVKGIRKLCVCVRARAHICAGVRAGL